MFFQFLLWNVLSLPSSQHISVPAWPAVWSCPFSDEGHWKKGLLCMKGRRWRWWGNNEDDDDDDEGHQGLFSAIVGSHFHFHGNTAIFVVFYVLFQCVMMCCYIIKLYSEESSAVRICAWFLPGCADLHRPSRAATCVCVWVQLGAAMSSAERLELPKEERLCFGGKTQSVSWELKSRLTLRDGRALTPALAWPGETFP